MDSKPVLMLPTKRTNIAIKQLQLTAAMHSKPQLWLTTTVKLLPELIAIAIVSIGKPDHSTI